MSTEATLFWLSVALVLFIVAALVFIFVPARWKWAAAFGAFGLAALTIIDWWPALKAL